MRHANSWQQHRCDLYYCVQLLLVNWVWENLSSLQIIVLAKKQLAKSVTVLEVCMRAWIHELSKLKPRTVTWRRIRCDYANNQIMWPLKTCRVVYTVYLALTVWLKSGVEELDKLEVDNQERTLPLSSSTLVYGWYDRINLQNNITDMTMCHTRLIQ